MKFDFILGEVEGLLKETNHRLGNIELLLESILTPPDLIKYIEQKKKRITNIDDLDLRKKLIED